eukprot:12114442-Alexandrium_andersonii.AAC.1
MAPSIRSLSCAAPEATSASVPGACEGCVPCQGAFCAALRAGSDGDHRKRPPWRDRRRIRGRSAQ